MYILPVSFLSQYDSYIHREVKGNRGTYENIHTSSFQVSISALHTLQAKGKLTVQVAPCVLPTFQWLRCPGCLMMIRSLEIMMPPIGYMQYLVCLLPQKENKRVVEHVSLTVAAYVLYENVRCLVHQYASLFG